MSLRTLLAGPIARGTIVSLLIRLCGIGLGVIQAILTARLLGPEGYGAIAMVLSLSMILATIALVGTEMLSVREVAKYVATGDTERLHGFLRASRLLVIATMVFGAFVVVLVLPQLPLAAEFHSVLIYAVFLFPIFALVLQNQAILRGIGQTALSQIPFQILRPVILVSVLLSCFISGIQIGTTGYLNTAIAGAVSALILAWLATVRFIPKRKAAPEAMSIANLAQHSSPFFVISILGLLLGEVSTLMLAWWSTPEQTGLFQPIARIAPLLLIGAQAASIRYASRLSELWTQGQMKKIEQITRLFTLVSTFIAVGMAMAFVLFGKVLLGIFGTEFATNTTALWVVAGGQIFNAAFGPVGLLLTMTNRASFVVWPQIAALIATLISGYALIPEMGVLGAAVAMSIGTISLNATLLIIVRRKMGFDPSIVGILLGERSAGV